MSMITIRFIGLCIHLNKAEVDGIPLEHRVVMLENECAERPFFHPVKPHRPTLVIPDGTRIMAGVLGLGRTMFRLQRVSMRIANESENLAVLEQWHTVPKLMPPSERIGLRQDVAFGFAAPASVYFDIGGGRGIPCQSIGGAISTRFEILTNGDPCLEIAPFDGGEPDHLTFEDGASISIANISTTPDGDDDFDYLLNYRIMFDPLIEPAAPGMPPKSVPLCDVLEVGDDLGPSCSNSNFP